MNNDQLKKLVKNTPHNPGIYRFEDKKDKPLYIGKASDLKNRLNSYLKTEDTRIKKMMNSAKTLKLIKTESDIEALILESQLIKKFRPQFNIVMRDDKQYFYIGFSNENFPKIFITHQPQSTDGLFFNPVVEGASRRGGTVGTGSPGLGKRIRLSVDFTGPFTDGNALKTTLRFLRSVFPYCTCKTTHHNFCLNHHIGKCGGICCLKETNSEFKVKNLKFKIEYQKNIKAIKDVLSGKKESLTRKLEREMSQLAHKGHLEKAIELRDKLRKLKRIFENAKIIKNSDILKSHRSGLESLLKTQKPIIRIEGYDVSNIGGTYATGSMVTFVNSQPDKNFYRKFKIRTKQTPDDTAMLKEILERRFKHSEWPFPDLILIDGGKGQINAARTAISNLQFSISKKIPIIAVTKNKKHIGEKIYISNRRTPIALTKLSPADRNLLLRIDSEAHRFAIGYYRKLHRKLFK